MMTTRWGKGRGEFGDWRLEIGDFDVLESWGYAVDFIGNSFMSRKGAKVASLGVFASLREISYHR
jgi:hypothetical protein